MTIAQILRFLLSFRGPFSSSNPDPDPDPDGAEETITVFCSGQGPEQDEAGQLESPCSDLRSADLSTKVLALLPEAEGNAHRLETIVRRSRDRMDKMKKDYDAARVALEEERRGIDREKVRDRLLLRDGDGKILFHRFRSKNCAEKFLGPMRRTSRCKENSPNVRAS